MSAATPDLWNDVVPATAGRLRHVVYGEGTAPVGLQGRQARVVPAHRRQQAQIEPAGTTPRVLAGSQLNRRTSLAVRTRRGEPEAAARSSRHRGVPGLTEAVLVANRALSASAPSPRR